MKFVNKEVHIGPLSVWADLWDLRGSNAPGMGLREALGFDVGYRLGPLTVKVSK